MKKKRVRGCREARLARLWSRGLQFPIEVNCDVVGIPKGLRNQFLLDGQDASATDWPSFFYTKAVLFRPLPKGDES